MSEIQENRQKPTVVLVSTGVAAKMLAMSSSGVRSLVDRNELEYVQKLPGKLGTYLFDRSLVAALATKRARGLEAQLAAIRAGGAA